MKFYETGLNTQVCWNRSDLCNYTGMYGSLNEIGWGDKLEKHYTLLET